MSATKNKTALSGLAERWGLLAPRERWALGSAGTLIFAALLWWIGISPALKQLRQASEATPQLDAQLQLMRAQASEATTLKAQRALSYDESLRSLEGSMKTLGTGASLNVSDARASITLRAVNGDALAAWLAQVRSNARLVPSELRLKKNATATPTSWDGSVVLNLPAR
ncbi:MAG: type II secretion system protein M [Burkholderiales bacterium]|nr:MAG: type II secretion system protein M [Burkholderiales bacterium]